MKKNWRSKVPNPDYDIERAIAARHTLNQCCESHRPALDIATTELDMPQELRSQLVSLRNALDYFKLEPVPNTDPSAPSLHPPRKPLVTLATHAARRLVERIDISVGVDYAKVLHQADHILQSLHECLLEKLSGNIPDLDPSFHTDPNTPLNVNSSMMRHSKSSIDVIQHAEIYNQLRDLQCGLRTLSEQDRELIIRDKNEERKQGFFASLPPLGSNSSKNVR